MHEFGLCVSHLQAIRDNGWDHLPEYVDPDEDEDDPNPFDLSEEELATERPRKRQASRLTEPEHGEARKYSRGCRCEVCVTEQRVRQRAEYHRGQIERAATRALQEEVARDQLELS